MTKKKRASPAGTDVEEALRAYADLLGLYPDEPEYLSRYAELLLEDGQETTAIEALRRLHALLVERGELRQAERLAEEFPQIGRVVEEDESPTAPLFRTVRDRFAGGLLARLRRHRLREGEHLYREGERGEALFLVLEGELALSIRRGDRMVMTELVEAGEIVGEAAFLSPGPRLTDAIANRPSCVMALPRRRMTALLLEQPDAEVLLEHLAEAREIRYRIADHAILSILPLRLRNHLARHARHIHLAAGQILLAAGTHPAAIVVPLGEGAVYAAATERGGLAWVDAVPPEVPVGGAESILHVAAEIDVIAGEPLRAITLPLTAFRNVVEAYAPLRERLLGQAEEERQRITRRLSARHRGASA